MALQSPYMPATTALLQLQKPRVCIKGWSMTLHYRHTGWVDELTDTHADKCCHLKPAARVRSRQEAMTASTLPPLELAHPPPPVSSHTTAPAHEPLCQQRSGRSNVPHPCTPLGRAQPSQHPSRVQPKRSVPPCKPTQPVAAPNRRPPSEQHRTCDGAANKASAAPHHSAHSQDSTNKAAQPRCE